MLKKRSKAVSNKQGVMSHNISLTSLAGNLTRRPISSLFPSTNSFLGFSPKVFSDPEASVMSSNSTLDFKSFSSISNPFFSDRKPRIKHPPWVGRDSQPIGLGIVDALRNEKSSMSENRIVLLGSQVKFQIPSISQNSSFRTRLVESPHSSIEFGVKNKNSQLAMAHLSPLASTISSMENSPRALCLSASEIELSEDYTCVISHGPQQKTTHIFDNFIIESCSNGFSSLREIRLSEYSLTCCHGCRNKITHGNDIFIYRGEMAFCSKECRNREIICQEGRHNSKVEDRC